MSDTRVATRPYIIGPVSTSFVVPAVAAYVGPGDKVPGALTWTGLRAYSAASCASGTAKCMQIVDSTGANATDIWLNTNGTIQTTGAHGLNDVIAGYGGNVPARVAILYDQTLSGLDFTQGTLASMPTVILNFFGSNPAIDTTGNLTMSISFSTTFPLSASFVMASTVGFFQTNRCWGYASALNFADGDVGNPTTSYGFGTAGFAGINPGQSYAVQLPTDGSFNTSIYVNGVNGAAGVASGTPAGFLLGHPSLPTGEQFMEWGMWAFNFSTAGGGECDLLNTNQHDYWGLL